MFVEWLSKWFEDFQSLIEKEPENVYKKESGDVEASQCIINTTIRQRFQAKPGCQEWVTVVECICADGSSLSPLCHIQGREFVTSIGTS